MPSTNLAMMAVLLAPGLLACSGTSRDSSPVALADAMKDVGKYEGRKACWVGRQMEYTLGSDAQGRPETSTAWMSIDSAQDVVPELLFVAIEDSAQRTPAAVTADKTSGDQGIRSVCGTIKGSREKTIQVGNEERKVQAPVLVEVSLDVASTP